MKWVGARGRLHSHMPPLPNPMSATRTRGRPQAPRRWWPSAVRASPESPHPAAGGPRPPDNGFGFQTILFGFHRCSNSFFFIVALFLFVFKLAVWCSIWNFCFQNVFPFSNCSFCVQPGFVLVRLFSNGRASVAQTNVFE